LSQYTRVTDGQTDGQTYRQTDGQTEFSSLYRVCITCSAIITGMIDLSYGIKMFLSFYHNARVCQTDRRTDISLRTNTALHNIQRGKNQRWLTY